MSSVGSNSPYSTTHPVVDSACSNSTSNAALRLALTAMKERCQQLQNRLSMMEEENLQLRIERHSIPGAKKEKDSYSDAEPLSSLHRKIEELSRQKSKLSHHIYLVANENKSLWETLSRLTDERNDNSPGVSSINALKPTKSLRTVSTYQEGHQLSLDEVPLKVSPFYTQHINTNLEDWNATTSIKECEYPIMDVDDDEDSVVRSELMAISQNLEEEKKLLLQQQLDLKLAIDAITKYSRANVRQHSAGLGEGHDSRSALDEYEQLHSVGSEIEETNRSEGEVLKIANGISARNKESTFEDRICPLCTKFYAKSAPFDEFNDHVLSHFVEDPEQDSHLSFHEIVA